MSLFCLVIYVCLIFSNWKEINFWSKCMKIQIFRDRAIEDFLHWNVVWPTFFLKKILLTYKEKIHLKNIHVWAIFIPNMTLVSRQWVLNFYDWRTPNSLPVEAQNPMQIVWICWKGTWFAKLSYAKHLQEDCRPTDSLDHGLKTIRSSGVNAGIRIFSRTYLVLLDVYRAFLRMKYRKKIDFCEMLESFLVSLMISVVVPLINNVSISCLSR